MRMLAAGMRATRAAASVLLALCFMVGALATSVSAQAGQMPNDAAHAGVAQRSAAAPERVERDPWPADVVEAFESLPVQDGGRIKPFLAFAKGKLTYLSERSKVKFDDPDREALPAMRWMLDVLFRPQVSLDDRIFLVPDVAILDAIELPHDGRKMRDRYTYNELVAGRRKLFDLTSRYEQEAESKGIKISDLSRLKGQIVALGNRVFLYERLGGALSAFRAKFRVEGDELQALLGGASVRASAIAKHGETLQKRLKAELDTVDQTESTPLRRLILQVLQSRTRSARAWIIVPPADKTEKDWAAPATLFGLTLRGDPHAVAQAPVYDVLARMIDGPGAVAGSEVVAMRDGLIAAADERGEYAGVPYELHLERFGYLHWVKGLFLIALALVAFLWWKPQARIFGRFIYLLTLSTVGLLTTMIVLRCLIRYHNPSTDILAPVTNLYETIPFITVIGASVLLFVEFFTRNRIALTLAILLGFGGSQLALGYAPLDGGDTLSPLQAVLVSNFWLLTHVQTVTVGYAASLLACLLAHVWLVARLVLHLRGAKAPGASPFLKSTMRMCYGAVAFGLVFSTIGTILGGIWANDSWGRFWGWDPKENGALMICLWQIVMLHSRIGGLVRHFGFAVLALVLGMITAFSWWHTNQLGVGLHSYGFTNGVLSTLWIYYSIEMGVIGIALLCAGYASMQRNAERRVREELGRQGAGGETAVEVQDRFEA